MRRLILLLLPAVLVPVATAVLAAAGPGDGVPRDGVPVTTRSRLRQELFTREHAGALPAGCPRWRDLAAAARPAVRRGEVPVAVVDLASAPGAGGGEDAAGAAAAGRLFAAAALRERLYHGRRTVFRLDAAWRCTDRPPAGAVTWLDPGDGRGWRRVPPGGVVIASYAAPGRYTVRLRRVSAEGDTLRAAFPVTVVRLQTPAPHDTLHITASEPFDGVYGTGDAYVYLSDRHAALANPVVIPEGFDLDNSMDWDELYDLLNQQDLVETLRARGYDAVVLNFTDATDDIRRNARVLEELLRRVRAAVPPDRSLAVIGPSMGGLVSRLALCRLEQAGEDPGVRTWISFDSPQRGADIPLGVQHWLEFFSDESADAAALLAALDTPAARQMLLYHHTATSGTVAAPDPMKAELDAALAAAGDWPQTCRRVAIINGSGTGQDQGFAPGDQLIDYTYRSWLVDIDGNVWALPDPGPQRIFQGRIDRLWPLPDDQQDVTVGGTTPWDGAPGGYRSSLAQMDTTSVPYGDVVALHPNHCFIPTVSALALDTDDPWYDVAGDPDLAAHTPFDAVYFPVENQEHVAITPESAAWFLDEIELGVTAAPPAATGPRLQAWPTPFNPVLTVRWTAAFPGDGRLAVYDLAGRRVRLLAPPPAAGAGPVTVRWDGTDAAGRAVPAGVYLLRLRTRAGYAARKVTLVR